MSAAIANESVSNHFSVTSRLRSLAHPVATYGSGVNFIRNVNLETSYIITEGGDFMISEDGKFLIDE